MFRERDRDRQRQTVRDRQTAIIEGRMGGKGVEQLFVRMSDRPHVPDLFIVQEQLKAV